MQGIINNKMITENKTTKFISALLIISMVLPVVLFSVPQKANALGGEVVYDPANTAVNYANGLFLGTMTGSTTTNTALHIKDYAQMILQQILKTIAKRILAKMTQSIINWINSDFHGAPLFIENPGSFFEDIAKTQIRQIVDMIGYDTSSFPFGPQVALNIIRSYKRQLNENAQYTLSRVINDPDLLARYRSDFNTGGWNGFLINTQYQQNNYLGFNMMVQESLMSRLAGADQAPAEKVQSLLQQGMGFLSPQTCPSNPSYNNGINEFQKPTFVSKIKYNPPAATISGKLSKTETNYNDNTAELEAYNLNYQKEKALEKVAWEKANTCPGGLVNTTPGSVAANQVMSALNMPLLTTALDGALGNSLAAIFDALLNHFMDKGLNMLSDTVRSVSSGDNWSYDGNSLNSSSSYSGSNRTTALNIPQNVSVTVGETTSTTIYGGTAPYSVQAGGNSAIENTQIIYSSSVPKISVTGISSGQTSVTIKDSSTPAQTVTVQITVNTVGALTVNPRNIVTNINNPMSATISGGQEPYFMQIGPSENTAIAVFSGTNLVVSGIAPGQTSLVIKDSSTPAKMVIVQITISNGTTDLIIPNVTTKIGETTNTAIYGGTAPYNILTQLNSLIANVQISSTNLSVTGITEGQTTIIVQDSSTPQKVASVQITVNTGN